MKTFITLLLVMVIAFPTQAQQSLCEVVVEEENAAETIQEEPTITPEEEQQAREIAQKFIERFEDSKDVLSLADDFYVSDFVSRLRDKPNWNFLLFRLSPELWKEMSDSDVKNFYFRQLQFTYAICMIYGAKEIIRRKQNTDEDEDNSDLKIEEILPPEVTSLMVKDETMRKVFSDFFQEENGETENEQEETELKTNDDLQSLLNFFDEAIPLMKSHLESLDAPHKWEQFVKEENRETENKDEDILNPRVTVLTQEFFGEAEGTRLICINAMIFHMDLVREDGSLKILNVYWVDD